MTDPLPFARPLADGHGRRFEYLRLSLTDVCNFRCSYCLPDGYRKHTGAPPTLSVAEIRRLVTAFAGLGLWKVRLTGGEPSLRRELLERGNLEERILDITDLSRASRILFINSLRGEIELYCDKEENAPPR